MVQRKSAGIIRRQSVIDMVAACVLKDRNTSYGDAEDQFGEVAELVSSYLSTRFGTKIRLLPHDVAIIQILHKISRLANNPEHLDSSVDVAGYSVCLGGIQLAKRSNPKQDHEKPHNKSRRGRSKKRPEQPHR